MRIACMHGRGEEQQKHARTALNEHVDNTVAEFAESSGISNNPNTSIALGSTLAHSYPGSQLCHSSSGIMRTAMPKMARIVQTICMGVGCSFKKNAATGITQIG